MAHSGNRRGVSKSEFNKRIRDLVSRDNHKLRETFDKFDKEYVSRMAELHRMQEKVRHTMRSLAIDKKHVQETSDADYLKTRREQKHGANEMSSTQQRTGQKNVDPQRLNGRRNPKLSVGTYQTRSLEVPVRESERRHSLPVYQVTDFTETAKSTHYHPRETQLRAAAASQTRELARLPQFPANNKTASPPPSQRDNYSPKDSPSVTPNDLYSPIHASTRSRIGLSRLSINTPPVNAVRRAPQAYGSPPLPIKAKSLDERKYISREIPSAPIRRLRSASLCQGLQPLVARETDSPRGRPHGPGNRKTTKRRRFSVPNNSAAVLDLSSEADGAIASPDLRVVSVVSAKPRRLSPAILIPGSRRSVLVDDDVRADDFDELHHCRYLRCNDVDE